MRRTVTRCLRAVQLLATDGEIPRPLRWLVVLGLLPIPGPFDEAVLLLVAGLLWAFYRERMREAWRRQRTPARQSAVPASSRLLDVALRNPAR